MIKTFTLNPSCINSVESLSELIGLVGIEKNRILYKYPRHWNTLFKESISSHKGRTRKKIFQKAIKLSKTFFDIHCDLLNSESEITGSNWYNKAVELYGVFPHTGIISNINPNHEYFVHRIEDLESWDLFNNTDTFQVKRTAEAMAEHLKPLLQCAQEIHFIDPYFENLNERHIRPLKAFLNVIAHRQDINENNQINIYYHTANSALETNVRRLNLILTEFIGTGLSLKIIRWAADELHNRFVLTDLGGCQFGIGLDDDELENRQTDDITPLTPIVCLKKTLRISSEITFMRYYDSDSNKYSTIEI